MDSYAQTGFQSACSEFSEHSLSLDQRFDLTNPSKILIPLNHDAPLFGMTRGNLLLIDRTQKPLNGDLILLENSDGGGIYRFEYNQGKPRLWPGNIILNEAIHNLIGGVIILLIKEFILPVPLSTRQKSYLHNSDWKKD
jgi:hypothetical protein